MPASPLAMIERYRIAHVESVHELREIGLERLNQEVKMIGHKNVTGQANIVYLCRLFEVFQKYRAIFIVSKNRAPVISAARNVIICPRKLDS